MLVIYFFFKDTATTEIYTYDTLFPYPTLFRSARQQCSPRWNARQKWHQRGECQNQRQDRGHRQFRPHTLQELMAKRDHVACDQCGHHSRSEEHTSELQSLMRISYAVFCLKKKNKKQKTKTTYTKYKQPSQ